MISELFDKLLLDGEADMVEECLNTREGMQFVILRNVGRGFDAHWQTVVLANRVGIHSHG